MTLRQAVLAALADKEGWARYGGLITSEFFDSEIGRDIYGALHDYWEHAEKYDATTFRSLLAHRHDANGTAARMRYLNEGLVTPPDQLHVLVLEAVNSWAAENAIRTTAQEIASRTFDAGAAALRFDALARALGNGSMAETSPALEAAQILSQEKHVAAYPFGIDILDGVLGGGLREGELGIFIAPSKRGKTMALCFAGGSALLRGHPVQHHTYEISRRRTAIRYYQRMLGWPREQVLRHHRKAAKMIGDLALPPWSIKDHGGESSTTGALRSQVQEFAQACAAAGYKKRPVIIVDYIDLIRRPNGRTSIEEGRHGLSATTQELREVAVHFETAVWTASQSNRGTYHKSHVRMDEVAESIGKVEKADVVIVLNQSGLEKEHDVMRLFIDKARDRSESVEGTEVAVRALRNTQSFSSDVDDVDYMT